MSAPGGTGRPIKTGMGGAPCSKTSKVESLLQWGSVISWSPHSGLGGTTVMLHGGDGASSNESLVKRTQQPYHKSKGQLKLEQTLQALWGFEEYDSITFQGFPRIPSVS